jgi:NTE family protein
MHQRLVADVAFYEDKVALVVLPPPCPIRIAPMDFGRAGELISRAQRDAHLALSVAGGRRIHASRHIAVHAHDRSGASPAILAPG